jgi:hypothetical protein
MSDVLNEVDKLAAFVDPNPTVAGLELRPFTAASLILMKRTVNGLLQGKDDNIEFDVAAFLYLHSTKQSEVVKAARSTESWEGAVLEFAGKLTIPDFVKASKEIRGIMEQAMVGQDYQVQTENPSDPN